MDNRMQVIPDNRANGSNNGTPRSNGNGNGKNHGTIYTRIGRSSRRIIMRFKKSPVDMQLSSDKNVLGISVEDGKVTMAICRMNDMGGLYPLSFQKASYGESHEHLPSISSITQAINTAYRDLRRECAAPFRRVFFGIPSWNLLSRDYSYEMAISPPFSTITTGTIELLEKTIRRVYIPDNYVVIDSIHKSFIIDNNKQVRDPIGMVGEKVRLNAHLVIAELGMLESLLECLKDLGAHVDVMVSPFVTGAVGALSPEELEAGVVLVDIGEIFTSCSFYFGGVLFDTEIVKLGGHYISSNIARNIQSTPRDIEDVVEGRKTAILAGQHREGTLPFPQLGGTKIQQVPMKKLNTVMHLSTEHLLDSLLDALKISTGRLDFATSGLVFIGENYLSLRGILDLAGSRINLPLRLGYPSGITGAERNDFQEFQDPSFVKLVGLIKHGYAIRHQPHYYLKKYYEPVSTTLWKTSRNHIRSQLHRLVERYI